jgi:hypothetical protein
MENSSTLSIAQSARSIIWTNFAAALCGVWLICNVFISEQFSTLYAAHNIVCGVLIAAFSLFALKREWLRWFVGIIGTWLLFAPLFFWAPTAFQYDGSTLIGSLVIAFSFLIPGHPGQKNYPGPDIPPGWSYNPSSWQQRGPLILVALIGFFLARYLAAYQLGYIDNVWDPFFGNGSERVLNSEVSKAFIISDAGLGAVSYLIDALEGFLGGQNRWRTMPWAVVLFAASIVPAGVTSIVLIMLQPIAVGAWCTICLIAACAMLIMVPYAFDELVATTQFLLRSWRRGNGFWHPFIYGGTDEPGEIHQAAATGFKQGFAGVNFPINLIISAFIGAWVMASPALLNITGTASDSQHLIGAIIVTIAITAMAEPCRAVRLLNTLAAIWLMVSIFILPGFAANYMFANIIAGIALLIVSFPKGKITERYGSFDKLVF